MDDMLTKSMKVDDHVKDLKRTFDILKKYKMRLNLMKCAFGVSSRKFMGFMVHNRGIEANPEKIKALIVMKFPNTIKEIQKLTEMVVVLTRLVSRSIDKCKPFFQAIKT